MPLPGHYQYRDLPGWYGAVAALAVLAIVVIAIAQLRLLRDRTVVQFAVPGQEAAVKGPLLQVDTEAYRINEQEVADTDVLYRLSGLADGRSPLILETASDVNAARVTQALQWANQAGFTNVAVRLR